MVVVDTDVLLLAFAFHQDARQADNAAFLQQIQTDGGAIANGRCPIPPTKTKR